MKKIIFYLEGNKDGTVGGSYYLMYDLINSLNKKKYTPIVGFHHENFLAEKLREKGVETYILNFPQPFTFRNEFFDTLLSPVKRLINFFKRLIIPAFRYSKFLKEHDIDLVNLNNSINRNFSWMLAAKISGIKCMTHEMGINERFTFLARYFGKRLESIICLSHVIHDNMIRLGVGFPHSEIVHCGIDLTRYRTMETPEELRDKYQLGGKGPVVGVVGNIKEWKGQETIVRATKIVKEKFPNIRCLLVGDYSADQPYKTRLIDICSTLDVVDNVIFVGFQRNSIDYMNVMDVVVHTSIAPEPFGIVTLEAMYLGKPLVSTDIGGPTEVVIDGETGVLVSPGKPELLAEALLTLLNDSTMAQKMGEAGKKRLYKEFTFEKSSMKTMEIYDRILQA